MNAIAGLIRPDAAQISLNDQVLADTKAGIWPAPHRRRVGYVFQDARLFPHLDTRRNLLFGQRFRGGSGNLDQIVDLLQISHLLDRSVSTLSGGEAQRVAIGRALLSDPAILLMDEPLASLDEGRKADILPHLERVTRNLGIHIFYVSHSISEIARLADHIALVSKGHLVDFRPADEILSDPAMLPRIGVREAGSTLAAEVRTADAGDGLSMLTCSAGSLLLPATGHPEGTRLKVRVLASDIVLAKQKPEGLSALNILPANIKALHEGDGPGVAVALDVGTDQLIARITRRSAKTLALSVGSEVFAIIKSVSVASSSIGVTSESQN